jgi:hypothetical protein
MAMSAPPPSHPSRPTFDAGPVIHVGPDPSPDVIESGRPPRRPRSRLQLGWFAGGAGLVLIVGLVVVLIMVLNGQLGSGSGPLSAAPGQAPDYRPPLARLCPEPSAPSGQELDPAPPAPAGPRTVDETAGISYAAYGDPWLPWPMLWRMGTLEVPYGVGQHFVTETYWAGEYHASILSAAVPATVNDSTVIDLDCVGKQVAADVQAEYYPQPNTKDLFRSGRTTLGGRPAWVTTFRLHFDEKGLTAKSELVGLALIDVGRPTAAVLYVSIPDTHRQWEYVVDEVLASVRPV